MCLSAIRNHDIWTAIFLGYRLPILTFFISMKKIQIYSFILFSTREINYISNKTSFKPNFAFLLNCISPQIVDPLLLYSYSVRKQLFLTSTIRNILRYCTLICVIVFQYSITYTHAPMQIQTSLLNLLGKKKINRFLRKSV